MEKVCLKEAQKVLFLGYGAVAKVSWNHFDRYFTYNPDNVYAVDQFATSFTGPNIDKLHKFVRHISRHTFDQYLDEIAFAMGDIIIDLTYDSHTYHFIQRCIERGIHYMNTSIEDRNDIFKGASIDYQQKKVANIFAECKSIRSNILTECGQNPGLIQHYVLYALNQMNRLNDPSRPADYRRDTMIETIRKFKVGSMLFSEWDDQTLEEAMATTNECEEQKGLPPHVFTNTWSVSGFLGEAFDKAEVVRGYGEFVQPRINDALLNNQLMEGYRPHQSPDYQVLFLDEPGLHVTLPTISPVWMGDEVVHKVYRGKLIHHGEIFELARYFGRDAPFMTYVYKSNPYIDQSIISYRRTHYNCTDEEIMSHANQPNTFRVLNHGHGIVTGQDSIGATIFCGTDEKIERIFWCGSLFRDKDDHHPYFTPTTIQVAAGVLSGLSYILEERQTTNPIGWIQSCDIDTDYMLSKSVALLGRFFFTEIPADQFKEPLRIHVEPL